MTQESVNYSDAPMQTLADVGSADGVWFENVAGDACTVSLSLPEAGRYRVIFVKLDGVPPGVVIFGQPRQ